MSAPPSPSPSPVQAPPVQQTPGPRATALQKLYNEAISHTLRTCSYSNFASCFPTPASHAPDAMKELHADFIKKLDHTAKAHFDQVMHDRQVVASLNDLDRLVDEARKRKLAAEQQHPGQPVASPVPPHTLPASSLYLSHLAPVLTEHQSSLSSRLQKAQSENAHLLDSVVNQRQEIERLVSQLEVTIAGIDAANDALPINDMDALTQEAVALDIDMRKAV